MIYEPCALCLQYIQKNKIRHFFWGQKKRNGESTTPIYNTLSQHRISPKKGPGSWASNITCWDAATVSPASPRFGDPVLQMTLDTWGQKIGGFFQGPIIWRLLRKLKKILKNPMGMWIYLKIMKWNLNFNEAPPCLGGNGCNILSVHGHEVQVVFRRARMPGDWGGIQGPPPRKATEPATKTRCIINWVPLHTNMAWRPMENVGRSGINDMKGSRGFRNLAVMFIFVSVFLFKKRQCTGCT